MPETPGPPAENAERLRRLLFSAAAIVLVLSPDGEVLAANQGGEELLGWEGRLDPALPLAAIVPPPELGACRERLRGVLEGRPESGVEWPLVGRDGGVVLCRGRLVPDEWQGSPAVTCLLEDETLRLRDEAELRRRTRQQGVAGKLGRAALEGATPADLAAVAARLLASALEVERAAVLELLPGGRALLLRAGVGWPEVAVGGSTCSVEELAEAGFSLEAPDPARVGQSPGATPSTPFLGDPAVASGLGAPIRAPDGPWGFLSVHCTRARRFHEDEVRFLQTVADLVGAAIGSHRAQESLAASEERFRALVQNSQDVITVLNREGKILYESPAVHAVLGYLPEELVGRSAFELLHPEDRDAIRAFFMAEAERPGSAARREFRALHRNGTWRSIEAVGANLLAHPAVRGIVINSRDTTDRRTLEQQLRQVAKMEAIGRLAGSVAHDFNNLLAVINGYTELLLNATAIEGRARSYLEEIRTAGERGARLTSRLLAFGRKHASAPRVLSLNDVVLGAGSIIRRLIGEDVQFVTRLDADLAPVRADADHLEQILVNLAVNARDAMPAGGSFTLTTRTETVRASDPPPPAGLPPGEYVVLSAADTGCGMDRETQSRIFEPFFTTKVEGHGTGLGLSIVYGIVTQSGGQIAVDSEPGRGTTFHIYLPAHPGAVTPDPPRQPARRLEGNATVLLVEDEAPVLLLIREVLVTAGYQVLSSGSGEEALRLCHEHEGPIHVLITDLVLPGMSGLVVAREATRLRPEIRVLYISGSADEAVVTDRLREVEDHFIPKPFGSETLAEKLSELLGGETG